ncbi:phosphate/phosphite/phosphonate ABC transporter substrate-binding protein [Microbacterium sp. CFH 90308]|uniref:Phosphate/phosphite/phosphonate ABC transporter substrate-binding protein n=1 Tax=Microbacterium salsuginis TaxID=2722803 RepID=A0ABX1KDX2_9MICO|nr:phosphate/phosphite/phosphonate ABC transporter substrate-binding protein [Microbacterium sp. CFH 90308]NLP83586.1 phosphate/phosphite/phosphonate ABC transporter substrate-binding protein [Microbacterium sp. CFH 90308]
MKQALRAAAAIVAAGILLTGCGASPNARPDDGDSTQAPSELVFAVVPTDDSEELENSFRPVVAAIEEVTGIPTRIEAVTNNAGVIEAQVAERVDIATYGAFSYYLASDVAEVTPVAKDQRTPEPGSGAVRSVGVVVPGSDITSIEDVAGKNVCFTDPASTTGYLTAAADLTDAGIDPEDDINPVFVGSHDVAVTQMIAGDCDIAFVAETFVTTILPERGLIAEGDTETVWTSDPIPGTPIVVGDWLGEELRDQIVEAVTGYNAVTAYEAGLCDDFTREAPPEWGSEYAGETACLWGGTGAFAFEPADSSDYDVIGAICEALNTDVCRSEG